ncbi:porin family protein [Fulvivirgaceae bacterium BMA12]|uniref:Porin family protein n=1 Tax=Agaribacillus aureus TaxID=3051825 RepID=A0ABT8LFY7_9BACT|nr:porin family protein [Fulvivirgaceae bacterium BMA12]
MKNKSKRKWLLTIFLVVSGYFVSLVQVHAQDKIQYSFDLGFTISYFDQKNAPYPTPELVDEFDKSSRTSFEIGGNAAYALSNALSLSSGLRYTERGGAYKTKNPDFVYVNQITGNQVDDAYNYLRYRLVYLEIPVLVKLDVFDVFNIEANDSKLRIFGGVSGMLNIGSKLRYNIFEGSSDADEKWEADKLDGAESLVLSWTGGVEWNGGPLIFYARYSKNLGDIYDITEPGFENFDVEMTTISFGMGINLN